MIQKKQLVGGLNMDDAEVLMDKSEYLGAFNLRFIAGDGKDGKVSNIIGNNKLDKTIDSTGAVVDFTLTDNITIGAYEDTPNRRVIFFNWSSSGAHAIYCYDANSNLIYTVLKNSQVTGGLNFSKSNFIHSVAGVQNLIYWTDNYNEPRRINIDSGIKLNHPTYVTTETAYPSTLTKDMIGVVRPQPTFPIIADYLTDNTTLTSFVSCQAAYRFVYKDGETSAFSELSNLPKHYLAAGYVTFTIPTAQKIPVDVVRIELAVKYLQGGKYYIHKTWDSVEDATAIAAHNSGSSLVYNFLNDSVGIAVADSEYTKAFDNVPLLAKTLEIARDRLFLGNLVEGYTAPKSTSLAVTKSSSSNVNQLQAFKSGATYRLGVVFYDSAGRYCGVVEGPTISTPERAEDQGTWVTSLDWTLTNNTAHIPEWATSYSIVRTKPKRNSWFVQFKGIDCKIIYKDDKGEFQAVDTLPNGFGQYGAGIKSTELFNHGMGYSYSEGDIAYVYNGSSLYKLRVLGTFSDYIITESFSFVAGEQVLVEIGSPVLADANPYYYEVGNRYAINNAGTAYRSYSATNGSLNGDIRIRTRTYLTNSYQTEVMNLNDAYYLEWYSDAGRAMVATKMEVKRNKCRVQYSGLYSFGSNNLSSFDFLDYTMVATELSSIQRLILASKVQAEGTVMICIGESETVALYLGETQVFDANGASFLARANGVIGNMNILKGSFGTLHPESASRWQGNVYFFDSYKGKVIRYDNQGLLPISDIKMAKYFRKLSAEIIASKQNPTEFNNANPNDVLKVNTITDPYTNEFLVHVPRMKANVQNELLDDMAVASATYNFVTDLAPTPTPTVTPTVTPTATPTTTPSPTSTPTATPTGPVTLTLSYIKQANRFSVTLSSALTADVWIRAIYADGYNDTGAGCGTPIASASDVRNAQSFDQFGNPLPALPAGNTNFSWSPQTICGGSASQTSCWSDANKYTVYNVKINDSLYTIPNGTTITIGGTPVLVNFPPCRGF